MNRAFSIVLCLVLFGMPLLARADAASSTDVASFGECKGPVSSWRENQLIEGGSVAGFLEATRDHQAWLDGKGYEVRIRTWTAFEPPADDAPPAERQAGKRVAFGSDVVYPSFDTFATVMSARETDRDEAYAAFVQKYRKNAAVNAYRLVCLSE